MTYPWPKLIEELRPFADKPVGSVRIDTDDIRSMIAQDELLKQAQDALGPFADLARWIAEHKPSHHNPAAEVQIEGWPYTLSMASLIEALYVHGQLTKLHD